MRVFRTLGSRGHEPLAMQVELSGVAESIGGLESVGGCSPATPRTHASIWVLRRTSLRLDERLEFGRWRTFHVQGVE